jgi:hypothetical protein
MNITVDHTISRLIPNLGLCLLMASLLMCTTSSFAESGNYRIEVLVFNHLEGGTRPQELEEIRSFSAYPELGEYLAAEAPVKLEVMSTIMQDAWRRLRLSSGFRPLLFASWEQTRIDYHPPVRLHDEELIAKQIHFPHEVVFVDLRETNLFDDYMTSYYRLDGSVQLRRSRFLHLDLDLEYRQDLLPRPTPEMALENEEPGFPRVTEHEPAEDDSFSGDLSQLLDPSPGPALLFSLKQSRQIRTGQMQYFDSPFLSVLVRVTATSGL